MAFNGQRQYRCDGRKGQRHQGCNQNSLTHRHQCHVQWIPELRPVLESEIRTHSAPGRVHVGSPSCGVRKAKWKPLELPLPKKVIDQNSTAFLEGSRCHHKDLGRVVIPIASPLTLPVGLHRTQVDLRK